MQRLLLCLPQEHKGLPRTLCRQIDSCYNREYAATCHPTTPPTPHSPCKIFPQSIATLQPEPAAAAVAGPPDGHPAPSTVNAYPKPLSTALQHSLGLPNLLLLV